MQFGENKIKFSLGKIILVSKIIDGKFPDYKKVVPSNNEKTLTVQSKEFINSIERVSRPGRRIFSSAESLPKINNGLGIAIVSTPKGVMSDINARKQKVGGEIICKVF